MANPRTSIFSKKVIRTNTGNSVEVGLFVTPLSHLFSCLFKFNVIADQLSYSYKFYLYQNVYIFICKLFDLNKKKLIMLYEDVKVIICKAMCSLVKQNVVCWLAVSKMIYFIAVIWSWWWNPFLVFFQLLYHLFSHSIISKSISFFLSHVEPKWW